MCRDLHKLCITRQIVQAVKNAGAVAAIIGVLEGQVHVGLSERDIDKLVADKRPDAVCCKHAHGPLKRVSEHMVVCVGIGTEPRVCCDGQEKRYGYRVGSTACRRYVSPRFWCMIKHIVGSDSLYEEAAVHEG